MCCVVPGVRPLARPGRTSLGPSGAGSGIWALPASRARGLLQFSWNARSALSPPDQPALCF